MELTWGIFYQAWEGYLRRMSQGTGLLCRPCKHAQYRHSHSVKYRRGWPASNKPRWYIHQRPQPQPDGTSESRGRGTLPQSDNVTTVSAGKGEDLVAYMKNNYGKGNVSEEICPKFCQKFKCLSAGIYEDESGMMQYYPDDCYACDECSKDEDWYSY